MGVGYSLEALPRGGEVVLGQGSWEVKESTLICHTAGKSILHWQDFSIEEGEEVRFLGKDPILNYVVGGQSSRLLGALFSDAPLFLINPQGIFIGPMATIVAQSFVATTFDLEEGWERFCFQGRSSSQVITNQGVIKTKQGVYLLAPFVEQKGILKGPSMLLACKEISVDEGRVMYKDRGRVMLLAGSTIEAPHGRVDIRAEHIEICDGSKIDVSSDRGGGYHPHRRRVSRGGGGVI